MTTARECVKSVMGRDVLRLVCQQRRRPEAIWLQMQAPQGCACADEQRRGDRWPPLSNTAEARGHPGYECKPRRARRRTSLGSDRASADLHRRSQRPSGYEISPDGAEGCHLQARQAFHFAARSVHGRRLIERRCHSHSRPARAHLPARSVHGRAGLVERRCHSHPRQG